MSANDLLLLLSAKTKGSWMQFRAAVEELHLRTGDTTAIDDADSDELPRYHRLRLNLQRLAHVEFRAKGCEDGWRVTPPTLALFNDEQHTSAVLCGARSPRLIERLRGAANCATTLSTRQEDAPDRIVIAGTIDMIRAIAAQASVNLQEQAPATLLTALPPVDEHRPNKRGLPVGPGWQIDRFSTHEARWIGTTREQTSAQRGLYRFQLGFQRFYFYCNAADSYEIPVQVGKYLALRRSRKKVIHYDQQRRSLSVPPIFRPPPLIERALILCTGSLPAYDATTGTLVYADIPPSVARLAAQILRQEAA